jgi:hypothetical protein
MPVHIVYTRLLLSAEALPSQFKEQEPIEPEHHSPLVAGLLIVYSYRTEVASDQ